MSETPMTNEELRTRLRDAEAKAARHKAERDDLWAAVTTVLNADTLAKVRTEVLRLAAVSQPGGSRP
jgi:hypothetical protein